MEGVAGAAQTGKAALYRRWASKADLVISALGATLPPPPTFPISAPCVRSCSSSWPGSAP
ncbi:TetR family transcriptional regulator [Kitasatospora paranensis]|uniref:TetR family transcriptional regulator n=1 Tax=Kitasatospora paranensis TaxID=258053 RepID=UPI0031E65300